MKQRQQFEDLKLLLSFPVYWGSLNFIKIMSTDIFLSKPLNYITRNRRGQEDWFDPYPPKQFAFHKSVYILSDYNFYTWTLISKSMQDRNKESSFRTHYSTLQLLSFNECFVVVVLFICSTLHKSNHSMVILSNQTAVVTENIPCVHKRLLPYSNACNYT